MDPLNDAWPPKMEDADRTLLADALRLAARAVASARLTLQTRWYKEFPDQEPEVSVTIRRGEIVYRWERGGDSREAVMEMGELEEDEDPVMVARGAELLEEAGLLRARLVEIDRDLARIDTELGAVRET